MRNDGAGRSVLVAADGEAIAGSHAIEVAESLGIPIRQVHVNGQELVALVRDDIPNANHPVAQRLTIADNASTVLGHRWDAPVLHEFEREGIQLGPILYPNEIQVIMDNHEKQERKAEAEANAEPKPVQTPEWGVIMTRVPLTVKERWKEMLSRQHGDTVGEKVLAILEKAERYEGLADR